MQGEAEHTCYFGNESVAGSEVKSDRGMGRGGKTRDGFVTLRRTCRRRDDERSGSLEIWNVSKTRCRSWFRLGLLRIQIAYSLFCQIGSVLY